MESLNKPKWTENFIKLNFAQVFLRTSSKSNKYFYELKVK